MNTKAMGCPWGLCQTQKQTQGGGVVCTETSARNPGLCKRSTSSNSVPGTRELGNVAVSRFGSEYEFTTPSQSGQLLEGMLI